MSFQFSQSSLNNMAGINQKLIEIAKLALTISWIDFGIPANGGFRTAEIQHTMFENKVSKCDGITNKSKHQEGKALDFYAHVNGKSSWDIQYLTIIAASLLEAARRLGYEIEWGGHWKNFRDYPHIQLKD